MVAPLMMKNKGHLGESKAATARDRQCAFDVSRKRASGHPIQGSNQGSHHSRGEGLALSRGECLWTMDQLVLEAKGPHKLMRSPFGQEGNGMLVVVALDRVAPLVRKEMACCSWWRLTA
jgi:hypothetical protein